MEYGTSSAIERFARTCLRSHSLDLPSPLRGFCEGMSRSKTSNRVLNGRNLLYESSGNFDPSRHEAIAYVPLKRMKEPCDEVVAILPEQ